MRVLIAVFALLPFLACSGKSVEENAQAHPQAEYAQKLAQDIQGPVGQFHQWTVDYSMKAPFGGTILLNVRNEKGWVVPLTIESGHRFYREWYALGKGQTTALLYVGYSGQGIWDKESYLGPDSPRVREDIKLSLASGGY